MIKHPKLVEFWILRILIPFKSHWIIDHESETVVDFSEQFAHHYLQLDAYTIFTKLDKSLLGIGINWIRYGKRSLLVSHDGN